MPTVRFTDDPDNPPKLTPEEAARLDAMTEEEIEANALSDPDNPPSSDEELERGKCGRDIRLLRERHGLTQAAFADRFGIPLGTFRDWEQGRRLPDATAMAYLKVIAYEPEAVDRALAARRAA